MRHLFDGLASLANPIGSPIDKVLFQLALLWMFCSGNVQFSAVPGIPVACLTPPTTAALLLKSSLL